jgi:hypothetical protein
MEQRPDANVRRQVTDEEIQDLLDIITADGRAVKVTVVRPFPSLLDSLTGLGKCAGRVFRHKPSAG